MVWLPKVSIICPIHNTAPYLPKAIDSFVNQTLEDIEIILINDDSSDESLDIINQYAGKDGRIQVYSRKHQPDEIWGYTYAVNIGRKKAQGEYIIIPDSDDYLELNALENLYMASDNGRADIVKGSMRLIELDGSIQAYDSMQTDTPIYNWQTLQFNDGYRHFCPRCPELQTLLIRNKFQQPIHFCEAMYMDAGTVFKLKAFSKDFRYIPNLVYTSVAHSTSVTRQNKDYGLAPVIVFDELEQTLKDNKVNSAIWIYFNYYKFYQLTIGIPQEKSPARDRYLFCLYRDLKKDTIDIDKLTPEFREIYDQVLNLRLW